MSFAKVLEFLRGLSLRTKLTILFVVFIGSTAILLNSVVLVYLEQTLQKDFDDALYNYAVDVSDVVSLSPSGDLSVPSMSVERGKILPFSLGTALIQVVNEKGGVEAQIGDWGKIKVHTLRHLEVLNRGIDASYETLDLGDQLPDAEAESYRMISFPLGEALPLKFMMQIAVPMTLLEAQIAKRIFLFQVGVPLLLLFVAIAAYFVSARAMAPITQIISAAQAINVGELSKRVPLPQSNDEIRSLGETINEMLARIEAAFLSQEKFVADASHQLLTPITILKGEIELLLRKKNASELELQSILVEVNKLTKITQDMLVLARADAGLGGMNLRDVALDELLFDSVSRIEKIAHARGVKIKVNLKGEQIDHPIIRGDQDLLQNLIFNLAENAVKYSPNDTTVEVDLSWSQGGAVLEFLNSGPLISQDQIPFLFQRFSRDPKRQVKVSGFGLGLAIAYKIAALHSGSLRYEVRDSNTNCFICEIKNI